jgi:thiol:disulfide interchange protein
MFAARLVVQVPLYLADQTQWLGATKLIMGLPLYAATLWVTWLLVRAVYAKTDAASSAARKPTV